MHPGSFWKLKAACAMKGEHYPASRTRLVLVWDHTNHLVHSLPCGSVRYVTQGMSGLSNSCCRVVQFIRSSQQVVQLLQHICIYIHTWVACVRVPDFSSLAEMITHECD